MSIKVKIFNTALIAVLISVQLTQVFAQSAKPVIITDKAELEKLKMAVEANPDSLNKHMAYIKAMGLQEYPKPVENPELVPQYTVWMKKYPKSAIVPYALGKAYLGMESPKAKPYLLKALEINPKYAEAWFGLWEDAQRWGEFRAGLDYLAKAVAADPENADYAFYYADADVFRTDKIKHTEMILALAKRFPNSERGAQGLYWLATRSTSDQDKIKYYDLLRTSYSPAKFNWSASGMEGYYSVLLRTDPEKAVAFATDMEKNVKEKDAKMWANQGTKAQAITDVKKLMAQNKSDEALAILNKIKLTKYDSFKKNMVLLKAQAIDGTGNAKAAYDSVMIAFVKAPTLSFQKALYAYGAKMGESSAQVKGDILKNMDAGAAPATPFALKKYFTEGSTSLADYKGKVVLLTYWFPGCGPCRGEFPHFENVVKQYKNKPFEYVGINIVSTQNEYVLPFMKQSGYSFTPLEDFDRRVKGNLDNKGAAPMNFLIDQNGRLIFSNFRISDDNEDDLKLMIDLLLGSQA
ncbi:MAG: redoxin protein [Mucilaginibacter sp.]|nr:redoxin protein [Mucilaginibacter sp.]